MARIEESVEVNAPARTAYEQLTKFEQYARFIDDVKEIRQLGDSRLHGRSRVGDQDMEWDAEITQQVPERCIAWRTTSGPRYEGRIELSPIGKDRTRVTLTMDCEPKREALPQHGTTENEIAQRTVHELAQFKRFIEKLTGENAARRGATGPQAVPPQPKSSVEQGGERQGVRMPQFPNPLQIWNDPFGFMRRMSEDMDQLIDKFVGRQLNDARLRAGGSVSPISGTSGWTPPVEVAQREQQFVVCAELPGVRREDVHIEIRRDRLTIEGERNPEPQHEATECRRSERSYGHFYRVIALPPGADPDAASASMRDGLLEITVPVPGNGRQGRKLDIQTPQA